MRHINIEEIEKGTALKKLSLKNYPVQKMVPVSPSLLPLPYLSIPVSHFLHFQMPR